MARDAGGGRSHTRKLQRLERGEGTTKDRRSDAQYDDSSRCLQTDNSEEKADIDYEDARILDKSLPEEPKAASKDPLAAAGEQRNSEGAAILDADLDDFDVNASTAPAPSQLGYKAGELSKMPTPAPAPTLSCGAGARGRRAATCRAEVAAAGASGKRLHPLLWAILRLHNGCNLQGCSRRTRWWGGARATLREYHPYNTAIAYTSSWAPAACRRRHWRRHIKRATAPSKHIRRAQKVPAMPL